MPVATQPIAIGVEWDSVLSIRERVRSSRILSGSLLHPRHTGSAQCATYNDNTQAGEQLGGPSSGQEEGVLGEGVPGGLVHGRLCSPRRGL